ncbi:Kazal-type serine protease inhibitor [Hoeflea sp. BAL378]|uniref:Kazal-type serine protease inhibitor family protein n=1 Tax=Hoeflea sp. BAL378 TaxID=1547437 RepID=UPI000AA2D8E4|nr:Kazal-type serine protease inhibitor [Hoeflea sp. BAL378]
MSDTDRAVRPRRFLGLAGASLLAAVALGGCEVTEASGNNYNSGPVCPMVYDPVCAERRGEERTFPNACEARAENWRVISSGQCRGGSYGDYRPDRRDYRGRDDRGRDSRGPEERNPYYRDRRDRGRDYRNPDYRNPDYRNGQPDFERPRFDNPPTRDPRSRPRTPPDQNEPPTYQPPVQPVQPVTPPPPPPGACARGEGQVCGQVGSKAQWFRNVCDMESAGGIQVSNGTCLGGNR